MKEIIKRSLLKVYFRQSNINEYEAHFNLGDIKSSREFNFFLNNGGVSAITDITLETDNPQFIISPKTISKLNGTSDDKGGLIPLISLGIIHGVQINGVGFASILEMGENATVLTISGKTMVKGVTMEIKKEFRINVNARVMDIELFEGEKKIDLLTPDYITNGIDPGGLGYIPAYTCESKSIRLKNSGNVDLVLGTRIFNWASTETKLTVIPNQIIEIDLKPDNMGAFLWQFSVDGNGTITNQSRVKPGNDGKGYFIISSSFN